MKADLSARATPITKNLYNARYSDCPHQDVAVTYAYLQLLAVEQGFRVEVFDSTGDTAHVIEPQSPTSRLSSPLNPRPA